jgi:hypothetical protein
LAISWSRVDLPEPRGPFDQDRGFFVDEPVKNGSIFALNIVTDRHLHRG